MLLPDRSVLLYCILVRMSSESSSSLAEKEAHSKPRRRVPASSAVSKTVKQNMPKWEAASNESEEEESDECTESDLDHSSSSDESSEADSSGYTLFNFYPLSNLHVSSCIH
jgi:hypothetical protein